MIFLFIWEINNITERCKELLVHGSAGIQKSSGPSVLIYRSRRVYPVTTETSVSEVVYSRLAQLKVLHIQYTYIATSVAITDPRLGNSPQYTVTSSGKNLFATVKGSNPVADIGQWCYYVHISRFSIFVNNSRRFVVVFCKVEEALLVVYFLRSRDSNPTLI